LVVMPSEQGNLPLSLAQWEAIIRASFREFVTATISSDTLTIPGSGRYKVLPQSGTSDQITSIVLSGENVEGASIMLRPQTAGHTITLVHNTNLRLIQGNNQELTTDNSTIRLWHKGAGVWAQDGNVSQCP
jgi:hypothetical protein